MARTRKKPSVKEILGWYSDDNAGTLSKLYRALNTGTLAGTGKMVILPVDQDLEHGPDASFAGNPDGYDPRYHFRLALAAGCNAHAAPLGALQLASPEYAGQIPLILKSNFADSLFKGGNPLPAATATVKDALRVGADFVGFTIYPGSEFRNEMYEQVRELVAEAKSHGLGVVIWSYPRGEGLPYDAAKKDLEDLGSAPKYLQPQLKRLSKEVKEGKAKVSETVETAVDVVSYAVRIACQLGAHIIKVKPPCAYVSPDKRARGAFKNIEIGSLADRVAVAVRSAFDGHRIVIFSGGPSRPEKEVLAEVRAIRNGGGFGSIMGRNAFQPRMREGVDILKKVMAIHAR